MQYRAPDGEGQKKDEGQSRFNLSWLPDSLGASFVPHRIGNDFDGMISGIGAWGRAHGYLPVHVFDEEVDDVIQSVCQVIDSDLSEALHSDGAKAELFPCARYKGSTGDVALLLDIRDSFFYSLLPVSQTVSGGGSSAIVCRERVGHPALVLAETDLNFSGLTVRPVLSAAAYAECLDRIEQIGAFLRERGDVRVQLSDIPEPSWILSAAMREILQSQSHREINHASEGVWIPNIHSASLTRSGTRANLRVEVDIEVWKNEIHHQISTSLRRECFEFTVALNRAHLVAVSMNASRKNV